MCQFQFLQEERRTTGRLVAIVAALFLLCIALYQAWIQNSTILASFLAPAVLMMMYAVWVVVMADYEKKRRILRVPI